MMHVWLDPNFRNSMYADRNPIFLVSPLSYNMNKWNLKWPWKFGRQTYKKARNLLGRKRMLVWIPCLPSRQHWLNSKVVISLRQLSKFCNVPKPIFSLGTLTDHWFTCLFVYVCRLASQVLVLGFYSVIKQRSEEKLNENTISN